MLSGQLLEDTLWMLLRKSVGARAFAGMTARASFAEACEQEGASSGAAEHIAVGDVTNMQQLRLFRRQHPEMPTITKVIIKEVSEREVRLEFTQSDAKSVLVSLKQREGTYGTKVKVSLVK